MANILQLRKGNSAQNRGFLGSVGELTYDTELDRLRVHNGTTVGGKVIVGTRIVTTPIDANLENTTGVRIINTVGNTGLPLDVFGALNVYSNENFAIGALRVYQTFQPDISNDLYFRKWDGVSWSAWDRSVKFSEKNTEAFGVGQSSKSKTLVSGTTYTNTTNKPITLSVSMNGSSGVPASITVNNFLLFSTTSSNLYSCGFTVGVGESYKVTGNNITAIEFS